MADWMVIQLAMLAWQLSLLVIGTLVDKALYGRPGFGVLVATLGGCWTAQRMMDRVAVYRIQNLERRLGLR